MPPRRPGLRGTVDRVAHVVGLEAVVGRPSTVWSHRRLQRELPGIAAAVAALERRVAAQPIPDEAPLFVLSAGWRSGSTLLQRLIVSSDRYFIWGEPYHQTDVVRRLAESLLPFATGWPPLEYLGPEADTPASRAECGRDDLSTRWIANHYPPLSRLLQAHRTFLRELLAPPPGQPDLEWGLKEVRLSAEYGFYLRLLFPASRFVFLVRDPRDAYRSYRERAAWFERWPHSQVRTPTAFGQLWKRLAQSFMDRAQTLDALLIRYEDLVQGGDALDRLERTLHAPVDRSVLETRISGADKAVRSAPSALELKLLDRATQPIAAQLGYATSRP